MRYPARAASWPAVAGLGLVAWFELVHPAPTDPAILAGAVAGYALAHLLAVLLFGPAWLARAETFSVFFRMISLVAPFTLRRSGEGHVGEEAPRQLEVTAPSLNLLRADAFDASGVVFTLLVLSAVSFDGLSRTFAWLVLVGVNPLVYPGRTALMLPNTLGLLGTFALLCAAFLGAVALGTRLGRTREPAGRLLGVFVLGTRGFHVVTSFLSDSSRVYAIWHAQVGLIVGAHVAGVVVAHALAVRLAGGRAAVAGQLPLLVLMIGYTVLGLWLLSTPAVG